jgi:hypothetical protein
MPCARKDALLAKLASTRAAEVLTNPRTAMTAGVTEHGGIAVDGRHRSGVTLGSMPITYEFH